MGKKDITVLRLLVAGNKYTLVLETKTLVIVYESSVVHALSLPMIVLTLHTFVSEVRLKVARYIWV